MLKRTQWIHWVQVFGEWNPFRSPSNLWVLLRIMIMTLNFAFFCPIFTWWAGKFSIETATSYYHSYIYITKLSKIIECTICGTRNIRIGQPLHTYRINFFRFVVIDKKFEGNNRFEYDLHHYWYCNLDNQHTSLKIQQTQPSHTFFFCFFFFGGGFLFLIVMIMIED